MQDGASEQLTQHWETGRIEAFSDGVLAIAITLLVLEIHIDPGDYDRLGHALLHEWPSYLAYVTSFLTVGSVWIAHHNLFGRLRYVDAGLLRLNLMLLMAASFLPFPTGVLAEALDHSRSAERIAIALYGGVALLIEALLRACVRHAANRPALTLGPAEDREDGPAPIRGPRASVVAGLYGAALLAGILVFPKLAAFGYFLVALRGVLVAGGEGRLSIGALMRR